MTKKIPLSSIRTDGGTQVRVALPEHRVEEYAEALAGGAEFPPAVVFHDGSNYWLADGFTRFFAHRRAARSEMLCEIRQGSQRDALRYACGANAKHGEPRSREDKQNAIEIFLRDPEWAAISDNKIAKELGVSDKTVTAVRKRLESTSEIPKSDVRTGRDGRTINVANIGKEKKQQAEEPQPRPATDEEQREADEFEEHNATGPAEEPDLDKLSEAMENLTTDDLDAVVRPLVAEAVADEKVTQAEYWSEPSSPPEESSPAPPRPLPVIQQPEPTPPADVVTLEQWEEMHPDEALTLLCDLSPPNHNSGSRSMNRQDNDSIEWAQWSWNPVTGCLHGCPYCYARDIAERFYPTKFAPTLWPARLSAPFNVNVPSGADRNIGLKNIFTCSMADLFGKWVPSRWIEAVLDVARACPQWNFLFLTKFPARMADFDYPDNAWLGTSVDCQARVPAAEKAFRKVRASVKWLSLEPILEPLKIDLSLFNWVVLGGASASTQTPEWRPDRGWILDIEQAADAAGCRVYEKANLWSRRVEYPGMVEPEGRELHNSLRYLPSLRGNP